MKSKLAILDGSPVRPSPFPPYPIIGEAEVLAVTDVLKNGTLSGFHANFLGGPEVQAFEKEFAAHFGVRHAISVNSGTAALHTALAAVGVGPGDEVIVPCYTFTATASAVLMHNAIPIFTDVDHDTFCMTADAIEAAVTPRTKAVIPVHLLGDVCRMDSILQVAKLHKLAVVEDNAQAPGARFQSRFAGTLGHAGTFSFVETKNMVTGEGGMVITEDDQIAERCRLIRNHGECYVAGRPRDYLANILGWNYRMTEIEATIGRVQLKRLKELTECRIANATFLNERIQFPGMTKPRVAKDVTHVFHIYGLRYDPVIGGVGREVLQKALTAEGVPFSLGYPHPLYRNPLFQEATVYGREGCPFTCRPYDRVVNYRDLYLPVAERLCRSEALWTTVIRPPATTNDMLDVVRAFEKIYDQRKELQEYEERMRSG